MKQPKSTGTRTFEITRIRVASTKSPVKRGKSRGIPISQTSMQPSQPEESKAAKDRPEQLKLHNRLSNKKNESSEEISPKKDEVFSLGSDNDDIDDSDDLDNSPQIVEKQKILRHATTVLPQQAHAIKSHE